ncbi:MAG: hypothetical protein WC438_00785 [Candidatus Pacearchaeota archaeon]
MSKSRRLPKNLTEILGDLVVRGLSKEQIDGFSILSVLDYVDLDIAFSPVVCNPAGENYLFDIPKPDEINKCSDKRYVKFITGKNPDFEFIPENEVKVMRARFLLLRDYYYKCLRLNQLVLPSRDKAINWYFNGAVFVLGQEVVYSSNQSER